MNYLEICNEALFKTKTNPIQSIPVYAEVYSTSTQQAERACRLQLPAAIDKILVIYPWLFNRKVVKLTALPESTLPFWQYAYALPTDYLRVNLVMDSAGESLVSDFDIVGNVLFSDEAEVYLEYGRKLGPLVDTEEVDIPPHIAECIALVLADDVCPYLEAERPTDHFSRLRIAIGQAKTLESRTIKGLSYIDINSNSWIQSRQ